MAEYTLEQIESLPEEVLDVLYDDATDEKYRTEIFPLLTEEQGTRLSRLVLDVYFKVTTPSAFVSLFKEVVPNEAAYKDALVKVLGYSFLPLADFLQTDVKKLISDVGGDPNLFGKSAPVYALVREIRKRSGITLADAHLSGRLDKVLESKALNARNDEQVRSLLTGPTKTSGVGLDAAVAENLVRVAAEVAAAYQMRGVDVVPDEQFRKLQDEKVAAAAAKRAEEAKKQEAETVVEDEETVEDRAVPEDIREFAKAGELPVAELLDYVAATGEEVPEKEAPKESFATVTSEDEAEIAAMQAKVATSVAAAPAMTLETAVDAAVKETAVPITDDDHRKRFQNLVSLYFRDLRDALETKSKLTMPSQSGGMGLDDVGADRVMGILEAKSGEFHEASVKRAGEEKERFVAEQTEKVMTAADTEAKKEKKAQDSRFEKLVVKAGLQAPAVSATAAPEPPSAPKMIPVVAIPSQPPTAPIADMFVPPPAASPGAVAPTAPPPAALPVAPQASTAPQALPKPIAVSSVPKPPTPAVPSPAPQRPVVSDVMTAPRLVGPVDELRAMALKDFRRLSKDPKEATLKVKDKIDLIAERGFELKGQAVKAWQESEPNRLYLDLLRRSLEGKPVPDVINEFEAKGLPVLTKAEFDALMALNRELRFG